MNQTDFPALGVLRGWGRQGWTQGLAHQGCCILILWSTLDTPVAQSSSLCHPDCSQLPSQQINFEWLLFSAELLDEVVTFSYHNSHESAKDIHILLWISAGELLGNNLNICAITADASLWWTKGTNLNYVYWKKLFQYILQPYFHLKKHKIMCCVEMWGIAVGKNEPL